MPRVPGILTCPTPLLGETFGWISVREGEVRGLNVATASCGAGSGRLYSVAGRVLRLLPGSVFGERVSFVLESRLCPIGRNG